MLGPAFGRVPRNFPENVKNKRRWDDHSAIQKMILDYMLCKIKIIKLKSIN